MSTNSDRILRAATILSDYDEQYLDGDCAKEQEAQNQGEGDVEDGHAYWMAVGDLLADLMHYCNRQGMDFDAAVEHARMHYEAEVEEGTCAYCSEPADEVCPGKCGQLFCGDCDHDAEECDDSDIVRKELPVDAACDGYNED